MNSEQPEGLLWEGARLICSSVGNVVPDVPRAGSGIDARQ